MNVDINKAKEWIDLLHPYMRWLMLVGYGGLFLYINKVIVKDPAMRKWILSSFEESSGKASGKSITAFVFSKLIAFSTLVAIIYSPNHLLPEYFLVSLLTFVGGLYGIKLASKYFNGTDTSIQTTASTVNTTTTTTPENTTTTTTIDVVEENKDKKDNKPKDEGDIG